MYSGIVIASFPKPSMAEDKQETINTILLQGARVETVMTESEFWTAVAANEQDNTPVKAIDVLNCIITFLPSGVVGFINREKMEIPEGMKTMVEAAGRSAGIAPRNGTPGVIVPGQGQLGRKY